VSVIVTSYLISDISGSTIADVSAISSAFTKSFKRAGYKTTDGVSLIAAGAAMGFLVPPAIFMIVLAQITNVSVAALFLAGFVPAAVIGVCLCTMVVVRAHIIGWPRDVQPSLATILAALRAGIVPLAIPLIIFAGFYFSVFTATEAGAVVAIYSVVVARFYYRTLGLNDLVQIAYETALLTAAVLFLVSVASIFQFLMGVSGAPQFVGDLLKPLASSPTQLLTVIALITICFGMVLEGLPAAIILVPIILPVATMAGVNLVHLDIVITAAIGIGLFLPPLGLGLLMALRFANLTVGEHAATYWPYLLTLVFGLLLVIVFPEMSLFLPKAAGLLR
jgi:tripartite ATP-independent transporter DctM subunit